MSREKLPDRRPCATFTFMWRWSFPISVTLGFYADGRAAEIFCSAGKSGDHLIASARDAGVVASIALQHGVQLETLVHAITYEENGEPASLAGAVLVESLKFLRGEKDEHTQSGGV